MIQLDLSRNGINHGCTKGLMLDIRARHHVGGTVGARFVWVTWDVLFAHGRLTLSMHAAMHLPGFLVR